MDSTDSNPYDAPRADSPVRETIGVITVLLISALSVVAGVCTFFVSCFGIAVIGLPGLGGLSFPFILVWIVVSLVMALLVARRINKSLRASAQKKVDQDNAQLERQRNGPADRAGIEQGPDS